MKTIRINFVDFNDIDASNNTITNILKKHYNVEITDNPDYIFYSVFGHNNLKYRNAVRIYYTGECLTPDFNLCDYGIGFDYLELGDRYLRYPLYKLFQYRNNFERLINGPVATDERKDFCAFVCSNDSGMKERKIFFDLLSKYKQVDSGGRYLNNVGGPVKDKNAFLATHKFSLAFENCVSDGYTTEKLVDAFATGTIPVYYGNPLVGREFNTKSFINCHDYSSFEEVVEKIKEIDNDDALYQKMRNANKYVGNTEDELEAFLLNIFDQPLEKAKRIPTNVKTKEMFDNQIRIARIDKRRTPIKRFKNLMRRIKNKSL